MTKYSVQLPVTGYIIKEVEAANEAAAIEAALELPATADEIEEWQTHKQVTQGNVCYAVLNDANAEEIGD
jgi:hypothetical protein